MSQQINLVNPLLLKKRYAFGLREMGLALGLLVVAALAWGGYLNYQAGTLEKLATQQETRQAEAQQELDRLSAAAARPASALLSERVKAAQAQVAQREALLALLERTIDTSSTGFAARMRALAHGSVDGVWLNGFTLSPDYVELQGSALQAGLLTNYIDRLGRQPPFAGMKFSGLEAELAPSAAEGKDAIAAQPGHIDFALYSGSKGKAVEGRKPDGQ